MGLLPPEVLAALAAGPVNAARLVAFEFASQIIRVWEGFGRLETTGGDIWSGLTVAGPDGDPVALGAIEDFDLGPGLPKTEIRFRLSVTPALLALVPDQESEVRGRRALVHLQFFDSDWQVLGAPVVVRSVIMDQIRRTLDRASTPPRAYVEVIGEPLLATKHYPPAGRHTDSDQQARFPGDLGHERGPLYSGKATISW